ncbi:sigma-70 factor domain-containing protein, partial [Planosporangium flavigriseum]
MDASGLDGADLDTIEVSEQAADERGVSADLVRAYLNAIGRTKLLTAAQEVELSKRVEAGLYAEEKLSAQEIDDAELRADLAIVAAEGQSAKDHLLEANLRLVVSI